MEVAACRLVHNPPDLRTAVTTYSTAQNYSITTLARTRHNCTFAHCVTSRLRLLLVINILQPDFPFCHTAKVKAVLVNVQQYMVVLNRCPLALIQKSTAVASFFLLLLLARSICDGSVGVVTGLPIMKFHSTPFGGSVHPAELSS
jgi:hypothetical protein